MFDSIVVVREKENNAQQRGEGNEASELNSNPKKE